MKKLIFVCVFFVCFNSFTFGQTVRCKTFLQGAYQANSLMSTSLTNLVPGTQPYNVAPWNYQGNETILLVPPTMVDWVLVELRDASDPGIIISRRAAILLNNGDIADTNLTSSVNFSNISLGNYYVCLYHRNHFPVLSANPVALPNPVPYDFSDTLNYPPYGGGSQALIELEPGVFGMIAGDVNKDGTLKYSGPANDRGPVLQHIVNQSGSTSITTTVSGYREEDINMNSIIKYSGPNNDPSLIIQNLVGLTGSTSITSVYNSIVPAGIPPLQCGDTLLDQRDGQKYTTVQIGTQCWMAENLAYLPEVYPSDSGSITIPTYYVYGYEGTDVNAAKATSNYQTYGVLYNWSAAMAGQVSSNSVPSGVQGICSAGWHLPSDEEWKILEGEVDSLYGYPDPEWDGWGWRGTDAGGNLKETDTIHWDSPNTGATNSSGFNALPGGFRGFNGSLFDLNLLTYFWSSTVSFDSYIWFRRLDYNNADVLRGGYDKVGGLSVRCIRDCLPQPTQSDAGPDSLNIVGDSIVLMGNTALVGQGVWTILSGSGGIFADPTNPSTMFYGLPGKTYNLVWTISNNCASTSDTVIISFAVISPQPCPGIPTFTYGGQTYNTVQIGTQCWMAENLNIGTMINGVDTMFNNGLIEKYCYDDLEDNCDTNGGLYQWDEMMHYVTTQGAQGICPAGWHVPTDYEWKILEGTVDSQYGVGDPEWDKTGEWRGFDAGLNLKSNGGWNFGGNGTDLYNFMVLPCGRRDLDGSFTRLGDKTYFWTSADHSNDYAWIRYIAHDYSEVHRDAFHKQYGRSVRCIRDCSPQPTQSNAGPDSLNITGDSIALMANTPVIGQGLWTILSGSGGNFADVTNPTTMFFGLPAGTYNLVWTINNFCASSSDTVVIGFTYTNCGIITDVRDGKSYNTVLISNQCWMVENLAYLTSVYPSDSGSYTTPYYYVYGYQGTIIDSAKATSNYQTYGVLYNWPAAMDGSSSSNSVPSGVQGVCPAGWYLPSDAEWTLLSDYLGGPVVAGGKMKETGTTHWNSPNTGATNSSGFTALPGGFRLHSGFYSIGDNALYWSSWVDSASLVWYRMLFNDINQVGRGYGNLKNNGLSVRCLKDQSAP